MTASFFLSIDNIHHLVHLTSMTKIIEETSSKEEKFNRLYEECLRLIHEKDLKAVTHSTLSRRAKVSRSWIYKYMGIKRDTIIRNSCKHFGRFFSESSLKEVEIRTLEELIDYVCRGTRQNLQFTLKMNFIVPLYIRFTGSNNALGETVGEIEEIYKRRLTDKIFAVCGSRELSLRLAHAIKLLRLGAAIEYGNLSPKFLEDSDEREKSFELLEKMQINLIESYLKK